MKVLVFAPWFTPATRAGGPARTLDALTAAAADRHDLCVLTRDHDLGSRTPFSPGSVVVDAPGRSVRYVDDRSLFAAFRLLSAARRGIEPDLLYVNSLMDPLFSIVPLLAVRIGLLRPGRVLLAPRGECSPAALGHRGAKKRWFLAAARLVRLHRDVTWHASSPAEAMDIQRLVGLTCEVVVRENEVDLPLRSERAELQSGAALRLVFLARLVPHKGLHRILAALQGVPEPVRLDVVGPEQDAVHVATCRRIAAALPPHIEVRFVGALDTDGSLEALRSSDALVTATDSENFGRTIAEAFAVGRPVLAPDTTPWTNRIVDGGGSIVRSGTVEEWRSTITAWARTSHGERVDRASRAADVYDGWRAAAATHVFDLVAAGSPAAR